MIDRPKIVSLAGHKAALYAERVLGVPLEPWQRDVLRADRRVSLAGRNYGKRFLLDMLAKRAELEGRKVYRVPSPIRAPKGRP